MDVAKCVWYVSGFRRPWEAAVIDNLAAALKAKGLSLRVCVEGGTGGFCGENVFSWNALTFFERLLIVLFRGRFWHLWGKAPFWWGMVRLRARTVHTSLEALPEWKGHPTRLFPEQAREGENYVRPAFEMKVAMAGSVPEDPSSRPILALPETVALRQALARLGMTPVALEGEANFDLRRGSIVLVDDSPSNLLLAAWLTLQGLPVVGVKSRMLDGLLGDGGYIVAEEDSEAAWLAALEGACSEAGRAASAGARRFLKENHAASEAADSLIDLYRLLARS